MKGIRERNGKLEIYFNWNKKRYFIKVNTTDIHQASKIREEVLLKIKNNTLTKADLDNINTINTNLFKHIVDKYIAYNQSNNHTKDDYLRILKHHWIELFDLPIDSITYEMLLEVIHSRNFKTNKTMNNCLIPLRGVFQLAKDLDYIDINPMDKIYNKKIQVDLPDPFTKKEMQLILDDLNKLQGLEHIYYWYYELAFWTGLRPSELIALKWNNVDWDNKSIYINRSRVLGVEKSVTKTHTARQVLLNDRSYNALYALLELHIDPSYILICPETMQPFYNEKPPRIRFNQALINTNIRKRPAYNTRHTYATMLLMDGVNPVFVANQLGHSLITLTKRYARWINSDKDRIEINKLNTDT